VFRAIEKAVHLVRTEIRMDATGRAKYWGGKSVEREKKERRNGSADHHKKKEKGGVRRVDFPHGKISLTATYEL